MMRSSQCTAKWSIAVVTIAVLGGVAGCMTGGSGLGGFGPSDPDASTSPPVDPRPPEERACPTGATLTLQLYQVFATPKQPDGDVWDGVSSGTQELLCRATSAVVRRAVTQGLSSWTPGVGVALDQFVGNAFQQGVAEQCGLAAGWLQMRYEGPDMFVQGGIGTVSQWTTFAEQDTWIAPRASRAPWTQTVWRVPCRDSSQYIHYDVIDEDVAFDDDVERGTRILPMNITPEAICGGWAWKSGQSGLVGSLFRLQVSGGTQSCAGISSRTFSDFVINDSPQLQIDPGARSPTSLPPNASSSP
jgi:hypothetical protein